MANFQLKGLVVPDFSEFDKAVDEKQSEVEAKVDADIESNVETSDSDSNNGEGSEMPGADEIGESTGDEVGGLAALGNLKFLAKIAALVGVMATAMELIKPIMDSLEGLVKAFLVPAANMLMRMLAPILPFLFKLVNLWLKFWSDPIAKIQEALKAVNLNVAAESLGEIFEGGLTGNDILDTLFNMNPITWSLISSWIFAEEGLVTAQDILSWVFGESEEEDSESKKGEDSESEESSIMDSLGVSGLMPDNIPFIDEKTKNTLILALKTTFNDFLSGLKSWTTWIKNSTKTFLSSLKKWFLVTIPKYIMKAWDKIKKWFTVTFPKWLKSKWESIKKSFTGLVDKIKSIVKSTFDVDLASIVEGAVGGVSSGVGSAYETAKDYVTGSDEKDFLMRPGQSPVSFSPNDTIIGTKNPEGLGGSSGGTNVNIDIQVDGVMTDKVVDKLERRLGREVQRLDRF